MKEKFMLLDAFDGYAISNTGKLKNTKTGRILSTSSCNGYETCSISCHSKTYTLRIHRLVALSFIENQNNYPQVNHIDGNKLNNNVTNLEWCTSKMNIDHARHTALICDNRPIKATNIDSGDTTVFYSIRECAALLGTNSGSIHRVLSGKRNKHKGYNFEYCN